MCCSEENRRTCVIGITIFCIVITALTSVNVVPGISEKLEKMETEFYGDHKDTILAVKVIVYIFALLCYTSCLIGAIKRIPFLLIPFMVLKCLLIILSVIGAGVILYYGSFAHLLEENATPLGISAAIYSCHWLFLYFLYVVIKLYKEFRMIEEEENNISMQQIYTKN